MTDRHSQLARPGPGGPAVTRAEWLAAAAEFVRPWFEALGRPLPKLVFEATLDAAGLGVRPSAAGACRQSPDGSARILISPSVDVAIPNGTGSPGALDVLLHELAHAALPPEENHGRFFGSLMRRLGFMRLRGRRGVVLDCALPGLRERQRELVELLGPYPGRGAR